MSAGGRALLGFPAAALLAATFGAGPVSGQLSTASAAAPGMADAYAATARGFAAVGANPARLGTTSNPPWSVALPGLRVGQSLGPVGLGDLADYSGRSVPAAQRREWLDRIVRDGGERGSAQIDASGVALSLGRVGFQQSTVAVSSVALNGDAAELLLFGNSGRTGEPRDFALAGSHLELGVFSTFAVAVGLPVPVAGRGSGRLAAGATLKYVVGHALAFARDGGSFVSSDPLGVSLAFPMIQTDTAWDDLANGSGFGLDVGLAYEVGAWSLGARLANVLNGFRWDREALYYRPGEALFDSEESRSDFGARPLSEAPPELVEEVLDQRFEPTLAVGAAYRLGLATTVAAEARRRFGDGIPVGPVRHVGLGVEHRVADFALVRGGFAVVTGGVQWGGGAGLSWGSFHVVGSLLTRRVDEGAGAVYAVGMSVNSW